MSAIRGVMPWLAQPLSKATKDAKFRLTLSQAGDAVLRDNLSLKAGWIIGAVGVVAFLASIFGWVTLLPLKQTVPPQFILVDTTSGYIGPATSVSNAPSLFKETQDHEYLGRYLDACEGWVPETDRSNDYLCKLFSRADQQERYMAWRKLPSSPIAAIGKDGHVELRNKRYYPVCGTPSTIPCNPKNDTREYFVKYDWAIWKGSGAPLVKPWTAHVKFQWHPELPMKDPDHNQNAGGFQSIALSAEPDAG